MKKIRKLDSYLGFASKSRNLVAGQGIVIDKLNHKKVKLVIITTDVGDNTREKIEKYCIRKNIPYRIFGLAEELSQVTGKTDKGIFAILDDNFAKVILNEIDQIQSEREEL